MCTLKSTCAFGWRKGAHFSKTILEVQELSPSNQVLSNRNTNVTGTACCAISTVNTASLAASTPATCTTASTSDKFNLLLHLFDACLHLSNCILQSGPVQPHHVDHDFAATKLCKTLCPRETRSTRCDCCLHMCDARTHHPMRNLVSFNSEHNTGRPFHEV